MSLPGPELGPWVLALVAWALGLALVGEIVRRWAARYSPWARSLRPMERVLVDVYIGGGALFAISVVPMGLFYPLTSAILILLASGLLAATYVLDRRARRPGWDVRAFVDGFRPPAIGIALGSAFVVLLVEAWSAAQAPTGNTFDSSVLSYYVAHLGLQHSIPLNFLPAAPFGNPYPQGTTVWLASYQATFGLPPARTSILVTPLFLALSPLAAYSVGDRLLRSASAGTTFAVVFAFVGSWTRVLVGGSNDFVFAFPLVLLLFARIELWTRSSIPAWGDVAVFGGLLGVAATLNPAGPIWLVLTTLVLGALGRPAWAGQAARWFARWAASVVVGVTFALPSLYEEVAGAHGLFHAGLPPGAVAPPAVPAGISLSQFIGLSDPFLFRGTDVWFSPFPPIRDELALLLAFGVLVLWIASRTPGWWTRLDRFGRAVMSGISVALGILLSGVVVRTAFPVVGPILGLTSFAETSILLFSVYTMVAALPIVLLVQDAEGRLRSRAAPGGPTERAGIDGKGLPPRPSRSAIRLALTLGAAFLLVAPGMAVTVGELPLYEETLYHAFGNVSEGDLDLLDWAGSHLGPGARVLVAPGSAAGFLPGYDPSAIELYPMIDGVYVNGSYELLVRELSNATLDQAGTRALANLAVEYVAVTGNNTELFRPFSPAPLVGNPAFSILFHEDDAYLFRWNG
ncbi:MAG: hypothetical protein L3J99_06150 [Thermoplasmata archaeon]|nr:hypothetical protein [Thermoplasmata archaeon]